MHRRTLALGVSATLAALALTPLVPAAAQAAGGTAYYVDCAATSDGDGSSTSPFDSLADVNGLALTAGDEVLFDRGTTCDGTLSPSGGGSSAAPILISAYGSGALPVVDADGGAEAVLLDAESYITVEDLELEAPGDNTTARRGVYVYADNAGEISGITLTGLTITDVQGQLPAVDGDGAGSGKYGSASGGIVVDADGTTTATNFNALTIEDNTITDVDREGVYLWSNWCQRSALASFWATLCTAAWDPATDVVIQDNTLSDIGGDGIAPMTTSGALIQDNTLTGFNERSGSPNAGMWTANSDDATFQFNSTSGGDTTSDGMAYDVDHSSDGTVFQYNLSYDNQGGFFLICPYNTPTQNFVIRDNISINDQARDFEICGGSAGTTLNGAIYNNTIYYDATAALDVIDEGSASAKGTIFENNIVRNAGSATPTWTIDDTAADLTIAYNDIYGLSAPSSATNTVAKAPYFVGAGGLTAADYELLTSSPLFGAGTLIAGNGGRDYFGNSVSSTAAPNIGAYNGAGVS